MLVVAIIGTLAAIAIPSYLHYIYQAEVTKAIGDIAVIARELEAYRYDNGQFPDTLATIGRQDFDDPWGAPYQYLNMANVSGKGAMRKDHHLVPLNTDFDLYSMGRNGTSQPPLTAKASYDDILRANNGAFIGLASEY
jgi:general secretion pathway protein G